MKVGFKRSPVRELDCKCCEPVSAVRGLLRSPMVRNIYGLCGGTQRGVGSGGVVVVVVVVVVIPPEGLMA
jgi:hypothetical protein